MQVKQVGASLLRLATLLAALTGLGAPAWCQQVTAAITGRVTDSSGAAIAHATVTATDTERGTTLPVVTNSDGVYYLPRVPVGTYNVKVEQQGFQSAQHSGITLVLNQTARLDVELQIGNLMQSVEVSSAAPLLTTESTQLSTLIDARTNEALPLATRNYVQLTLLAPGSLTTDPQTFTGPQATFSGGRPYINGNREEANNFILDGMDNNQVSENGIGYTPSVDAIEEFNMITQNAPADFGHFMGGIVSVSIKSGTNQYHGSVFEFIRNDQLNANTWSNNWNGLKRPLLRWNEFGGAAGGPILRNRLFFFADYQGSRFDQPATNNSFTVLTPAERTGNFSQLLAQGTQLRYPGTNLPVTGNIFPSNLLSPQAVAIMGSALYPQPINGGLTNNAVNTAHQNTNQDQGDIKVDWNASSKDHVYGRYSQAHVIQPTTNSIALLYNSQNQYPSYNGVLDYTRTISATFVNDLRVGVNYFPAVTGVLSGAAISAASVGIPGVPTDTLPGFVFTAGNLSNVGTGFGNPEVRQEFSDTTGEIEDTAIVTRGTHTMRFGFQFFRYRLNTYYSGNAGVAGQFDFSGQYTGAAEADFMAGRPTEVQGGIAGGTWGQRSSIYSGFFQDDWHATSHLVFNLGLRYEVNTPWIEVHDRQSNFGVFNGTQYLAGQECRYSNCHALYNQYNGIANYQPRIGIAWTPGGKNTVIRAGVTTSTFLEGTGTNARLPLNPPFATEHDIRYTASQTPPTLAQGYTVFGGTDPATEFVGASLRIWDPNFRPAVSDQWNFTIQHQFSNSMTAQIGYVGQRNTHLTIPVISSQKVLNPDGTVSPSPFLGGNPLLQSQIGTAKTTETASNQSYNALQAVFQRRLNNGLEFQANYTWSKCMSNSRGFYGATGQAAPEGHQQNAYDAAAEWGPCYYDVTHSFNGYVTYDLPFGRGRAYGHNLNKAENALIGDWQINTILSFRGGFPLTVTNYQDSSQTGSTGPRANCIAPANVFGEMDSPSGGYQWFDPRSYAAPAAHTFGNCGNSTVRGPGITTADLSLSKRFNFTERQNLEFRAEAVNFTNTPILNAPNAIVPGAVVSKGEFGVGNFGRITSSQGARQMQFALKYHF